MENLISAVETASDDSPVWMNKSGVIKMTEMSNEYLQHAFVSVQMRILTLHNKMKTLSTLEDQLDNEAKSRGIVIVELDSLITGDTTVTQFFKNNRKAKYLFEKSKTK